MQITYRNEPLCAHTTFKLGGIAGHFTHATSIDDITNALAYARTHSLPCFVLGGGSNVLCADSGFTGLVIHIVPPSEGALTIHANHITAHAGVLLSDVVASACEHGLSGIEALNGIPGTLGGAVRGNAGAFGTEIADVVHTVEAVHTYTGEVRTFTAHELNAGYRTTVFKNNADWIILSATLTLSYAPSGSCVAKAQEILAEREKRQLQNIRSAGSYFQNPVVDDALAQQFEKEKGAPARNNRVPAGWLIDKVGYKGVCKDGACTGKNSANYIINDGTATAVAVQALANEVATAVREQCGVELVPEVTLLGFADML